MVGMLYVGRLVEVVIVAILFKIHFTQKMGILCCGASFMVNVEYFFYRGADKSLARPASQCILFLVRIFHLMLVLLYIYIYINSTNIPPIMIINRMYETQNLLSSFISFLVGLRTYQHPYI